MAKARKDQRGRVLKTGEQQRKDKIYQYSYTDPLGRRRFIYAGDLVTLREKEKQLTKDQLDGLDLYVSGRATVNDTFDRYISAKYNLKDQTKTNYMYMYDRFVRDTFGMKKIKDIKYSDVLQFYYYLLNERGLGYNTLDSVHTLLHPTFQLAVRDDIIRKNPTDGVMKEIAQNDGKNKGIRRALKIEEQRAFMDYIANHPVYYHWWPMFTILLGTGCRIGEALGLRWEDVDFEKRMISINHTLVYYKHENDDTAALRVSTPKTDAGTRSIPMLNAVFDAFQMLYEEQKETGFNENVIDGMNGFVFCDRFHNVPNPSSVNRAIKRIVNTYNNEEILEAARKKRTPLILPEFSCHQLRHTFCTRLCENETNLKVIQSVMGHRDIATTMDIYAEATDTKKRESFDNLSHMDIF